MDNKTLNYYILLNACIWEMMMWKRSGEMNDSTKWANESTRIHLFYIKKRFFFLPPCFFFFFHFYSFVSQMDLQLQISVMWFSLQTIFLFVTSLGITMESNIPSRWSWPFIFHAVCVCVFDSRFINLPIQYMWRWAVYGVSISLDMSSYVKIRCFVLTRRVFFCYSPSFASSA